MIYYSVSPKSKYYVRLQIHPLPGRSAMLFNSQFFIFIFLPICLAGWFVLNRFKLYKPALVFLIGMSLWFYGYFNPVYLIIIISSIAVNYLISFLMEKLPKAAKPLFITALVLNIGLLGYFKYYDFFIENINAVFKAGFALKHILLPLGISFFTLQQISFIIDRYWGSAPHYDIISYAAYVTFFPQLIAGPIVRHDELIPQLNDIGKRRFNIGNFKEGIVTFSLGLAKKTLIADFFALPVNFGFDNILYIDTPSAWLIAISYTFELYFDFSGYCDMAIGLGKMFNFDLPVNFNSPYKFLSVTEYWTRWHATLTRFFTSYIYTPMTMYGVRKKKRKLFSIITPLVVFFISGFWHGASWTFIIWGVLYGIATVWSQRKRLKIKNHVIAWIGMFFFTIVMQTIFRCETLDNMLRILKAMFVPGYSGYMLYVGGSLSQNSLLNEVMGFVGSLQGNRLNIAYLLILAITFIITGFILRGKNSLEISNKQKEAGYKTPFLIFLGVITAWSIVSLTGVSTFLYFNF